ncbi:FMN-binding negative transcriptional regulator [Sneathiella sp. P13V-1]|uniref:FMN-binding negative transcriptional regulator n=1 Tax=Sneathiella sp. P13V-1 TaxID=2697366 RepID=UPI00187B8C4B|nr:FMN-binding negative transcriptional regulator [Sneathiella sp. P13V-1]MBE7636323.1 FMN-binding negative transcriptional regulator [Sneathiella sp. P13V-1]
MYIPPHFKVPEKETLKSLLPEASFAIMASTGEDGLPFITHLPVSYDPDGGYGNGCIYGHVSKANGHHLLFGKPARMIFSGPHAYVSPRFYASDVNVPTWNYVAVHATGTPVALQDPDKVIKVLEKLTKENEEGREQPWTMGELDEKRIQGLLKGIVAFEMPVGRLEAKAKLGQNKSAEDRQALFEALEGSEIGGWQKSILD